MFFIANFILALAKIIDIVLFLFYWLILFRAIISWVSPDPFNPVVQFLHRTTDPILEPIRRFLPSGRIDLSPIVAFLIIIFLQTFLVASLRDMASRMRSSRSNIIFESAPSTSPQREELIK